MKTVNTKVAILLSTLLVATYGCQSTSTSATNTKAKNTPVVAEAKASYTVNGMLPSADKFEHAKVLPHSGNGVKVEYDGISPAEKTSKYPSAKFMAKGGTWDWSDKENVTVDITNTSDKDFKMTLAVFDSKGNQPGAGGHRVVRAFMVPAGKTNTINLNLKGGKNKVPGHWGGEQMNLKEISIFAVNARDNTNPQSIIIDNFEVN
ncbi:hypothetical protein [Vibrio sp. WXL210]|uniref:hypothetical protein n=1 Tax=Vibrio sp. WXL210 TaxID=3450709 RepID=UPI003EC5526F